MSSVAIDDGFPGLLTLRPEWFSELQDALHQAGLARDLHYPMTEQPRHRAHEERASERRFARADP
jgi:hypothetical protein